MTVAYRVSRLGSFQSSFRYYFVVEQVGQSLKIKLSGSERPSDLEWNTDMSNHGGKRESDQRQHLPERVLSTQNCTFATYLQS